MKDAYNFKRKKLSQRKQGELEENGKGNWKPGKMAFPFFFKADSSSIR